MSQQTAPTILPIDAAAADQYHHLYCCDPNRSWCGADITNDNECPEGECTHPRCPLCLHADLAYLACRCQWEDG